jgi:hypothetical protein
LDKPAVQPTRDEQPTQWDDRQRSCRVAKTSPLRYSHDRGDDLCCDAEWIRRADSIVIGFQSPVGSKKENGGQEMDTNKHSQKRLWIIAGLLVLALIATGTTGCGKATVSGTVDSANQTISGTVNSTFVDVDGLVTAPTRVTTSYPTENLDTEDGRSMFLGGILYTFSDHSDDWSLWMTAWDPTTGKKLWSLDMKQDWYASFASDGKYLFFWMGRTLGCLDKATGATVWKSTPSVAPPFAFDVRSDIAMHINENSHLADRLYVIGGESETLPPQVSYEGKVVPPGTSIEPEITEKMRRLGIWILDAATGKSLGRIDLPTLTFSNARPELLCDGATLYAGIPESADSEYPVQKSSLAAFDLTTNEMLWKESVDGEGTDLVKQGNMLILLRSHAYADEWIDAWQIGRSPDSTKRLWTRQTESTPEEGNITTFAVDSKHVYLQGSKGTFRALELVSGKEARKHQFAPSKGPITDGPDVGKLHDTYPTMTLTTTRNVLYVQDGGGLVAGFDPATGKELWNRRISHIQIGQVHTTGWFSLQVVDKGFFVVWQDGKVDLWR